MFDQDDNGVLSEALSLSHYLTPLRLVSIGSELKNNAVDKSRGSRDAMTVTVMEGHTDVTVIERMLVTPLCWKVHIQAALSPRIWYPDWLRPWPFMWGMV